MARPTRTQRRCRRLPRSVIGCWVPRKVCFHASSDCSKLCLFFEMVSSLSVRGCSFCVSFRSLRSLASSIGGSRGVCTLPDVRSAQNPILVVVAGHLRDKFHHSQRALLLDAAPLRLLAGLARLLPCCHHHLCRHFPMVQVHAMRCRTCAEWLCGGFRSLEVVLKRFSVVLEV